jgi:long-chain fatty acid transport protein
MKIIALIIIFVGNIIILPVYAAGFAVMNESPALLGQAYAGAAATTNDISSQFFNPATLTAYSTPQISAATSLILPNFTAKNFTGTTADATPINGRNYRGDIIKDVAIPSFYASAPINPKTVIGMSITTPWGLTTSYDDTWTGRYYGVTSQLQSLNITPAVAHKFSDTLSLGAGIQAQYLDGRMSNAIDCGTILTTAPGANDCFANMTGNDWGYGYTLGALWQPTTEVRLGLSYNSAVKHNLKGNVAYELPNPALAGVLPNGGISLNITTPATLRLGGEYDVTPEWTLSASVHRVQWNVVKTLSARFDSGQADDNTPYNWRNTWFASIGARFQPGFSPWSYRIGTGFDQSPVSNEQSLNVRIPDADRYWLGMGVGYALSDAVRLDATYLAMWFDAATVHLRDPGGLKGSLNGQYESYLDIVALRATASF